MHFDSKLSANLRRYLWYELHTPTSLIISRVGTFLSAPAKFSPWWMFSCRLLCYKTVAPSMSCLFSLWNYVIPSISRVFFLMGAIEILCYQKTTCFFNNLLGFLSWYRWLNFGTVWDDSKRSGLYSMNFWYPTNFQLNRSRYWFSNIYLIRDTMWNDFRRYLVLLLPWRFPYFGTFLLLYHQSSSVELIEKFECTLRILGWLILLSRINQ